MVYLILSLFMPVLSSIKEDYRRLLSSINKDTVSRERKKVGGGCEVKTSLTHVRFSFGGF